jgi:hypothetical protein
MGIVLNFPNFAKDRGLETSEIADCFLGAIPDGSEAVDVTAAALMIAVNSAKACMMGKTYARKLFMQLWEEDESFITDTVSDVN